MWLGCVILHQKRKNDFNLNRKSLVKKVIWIEILRHKNCVYRYLWIIADAALTSRSNSVPVYLSICLYVCSQFILRELETSRLADLDDIFSDKITLGSSNVVEKTGPQAPLLPRNGWTRNSSGDEIPERDIAPFCYCLIHQMAPHTLCSYPSCFNAPMEGSPGMISVKFCTEVREWLRYTLAKKYCRKVQPLSRAHELYRQTTDGFAIANTRT